MGITSHKKRPQPVKYYDEESYEEILTCPILKVDKETASEL